MDVCGRRFGFVFALSSCALVAPVLEAQTRFSELRGHEVAQVGWYAAAIATVDVDRDGDLDLIVGNGGTIGFEEPGLYLNDGTGRFTYARDKLPLLRSLVTCIGVGDLDGDGWPDVVLGSFGYGFGTVRNRMLRNDGAGGFVDVTESMFPPYHSTCGALQFSDATTDLVLADVDGDGDLDIVFANWCQDRLYLNDGRGNFVDATFQRMVLESDTTNCVVAADFDGDGAIDLAFGNMHAVEGRSALNRLCLNDGNGFFRDASDRLPQQADETMAMAAADVDGDGDVDLIVGNGGYTYGSRGQQNRLWRNDGRGRFTDATAGNLPSLLDNTQALVATDLDGDGDADLYVANGRFGTMESDRILWNSGNGAFTGKTVGETPLFPSETMAIAPGDIDGDGDVDLVVGRVGGVSLWLNQRRHVFVDAVPRIGEFAKIQVALSEGRLAAPAVARLFLGLHRASLRIEPLGVLGIDPTTAVELQPVMVPAPMGIASTGFEIPNDPSLRGVAFHLQMLALPHDLRLSNVWSDRVR